MSRMGAILASAALLGAALVARPLPPGNGWVSLFNSKDLTGWSSAEFMISFFRPSPLIPAQAEMEVLL